ncbi:MAG: DUF2807 domain-containing protein [Bacteroidales bacterium]|nr:DUF2807 domain-containing protein [Bacteroidales bacterium]
MKIKFIYSAIVLVILASSINVYGVSEKKETRKVASFSELGLSILADVYISQGNKTELIIEGDENTIEHIETKISGGKLKITYDTRNSWKYKKVKIYISSPNWEGIYMAGSGNITNQTAIEGEQMDIAVSGSGDITIDDLKAVKIGIRISGSGDISLKGSDKTESLEVSISGSGDVDVSGIFTDKAKVRISGSGGAKVYAETDLEVSISGSGSVYYKGNALIDARISGSGKVKNFE